jgi:hypothetical protein
MRCCGVIIFPHFGGERPARDAPGPQRRGARRRRTNAARSKSAHCGTGHAHGTGPADRTMPRVGVRHAHDDDRRYNAKPKETRTRRDASRHLDVSRRRSSAGRACEFFKHLNTRKGSKRPRTPGAKTPITPHVPGPGEPDSSSQSPSDSTSGQPHLEHCTLRHRPRIAQSCPGC